MKFKKQKLLTVVVFLFLLTTLALAACGAKAHDFSDGEWEVTKEAACTESGSKQRVCTVEGCGRTEVVTVPALGHDLIPEQITDRPLCETGGTMTMKCSRCDFKDEITLQPFNHVHPQAPDCAEGVKCMVCGKERIPLKEHAYKTEAGHEHECADCGYAYTSDLVFTAINDGKEWRVSEPDGNAFWSVKELVVPAYKEGKPVTELAEGSFNNDYSLQAVRLPYTLKKLNGNFISCNSLISLNVPDSVDYMGGSFAGSKILDVMKYNTDGDGLAVLGGWVFGISDSVERFVLPEGLKGAVSGIFKSPALKHVELPDNYVMSNGEFQPVYNSTTSLESVVLPDTLAFLPDNAFRSCVALEQITIPASVTSGKLCLFGLHVFEKRRVRWRAERHGYVRIRQHALAKRSASGGQRVLLEKLCDRLQRVEHERRGFKGRNERNSGRRFRRLRHDDLRRVSRNGCFYRSSGFQRLRGTYLCRPFENGDNLCFGFRIQGLFAACRRQLARRGKHHRHERLSELRSDRFRCAVGLKERFEHGLRKQLGFGCRHAQRRA